jgi:hypothetical protein
VAARPYRGYCYEFLELVKLAKKLDVNAWWFRLDHLQPARRDFEIPPPCTFEEPGLAKISFRHSVAKDRLPTGCQQLRSLFWGQGELFGESLNKIPNSDFTI